MLVRARLLLALCFALPLSPAVAAAAACMDSARTQEAVAMLSPLAARTEELVALAISEGVSSQSIYLLSRQMMLVERIHRLLVDRGNCASQADNLGRDVSIVKRVFAAFADGSAELHIEAMKAEQSQAILGEVNAQVAKLESLL